MEYIMIMHGIYCMIKNMNLVMIMNMHELIHICMIILLTSYIQLILHEFEYYYKFAQFWSRS